MPTPTLQLAKTVTVVHTIACFSQPALDAAVQAIAWQDSVLDYAEVTAGFFRLTDAHGHHSYLPTAACLPHAMGRHDAPCYTEVVQPVTLYRQPLPGNQYVAVAESSPMAWFVFPGDPLLLLGYAQHFALIQRADGRIGYVPVQLCTTLHPPEARPLFDPATALLGMLWCGSQALILPQVVGQPQLTMFFDLWYLRFIGMTALILLLWFAGAKRMRPRSFALGIAGAYLLLEGLGRLTVL